MILSFLCGRHTGRKREFASVSENEALVSFPDRVRDKLGEEHYIVDHSGHFLSTADIVNQGMDEGYLTYSGYHRLNGIIRHTYIFHGPLME